MQIRSLFCLAVLSLVTSVGWSSEVGAARTTGTTGTAGAAGTVRASNSLGSAEAAEVPEAPDDIDSALPAQELTLTASTIGFERPAKGPMVIVVEQDRHITHVLQNHDGKLKEIFSARNTTGKKTTPTPNGRMQIINKRWDPEWRPPVSIDPRQHKVESWSKNKHNPLGVAWMGLNAGCVGLHGTNAPAMIGRSASHGCVRHKNEDIKKLFALVSVGTPVYIVQKYDGTKVMAEDVAYLNLAPIAPTPQVVAQVHQHASSQLVAPTHQHAWSQMVAHTHQRAAQPISSNANAATADAAQSSESL